MVSSEELLVAKEEYFAGIRLDPQTVAIPLLMPAVGKVFLTRRKSCRFIGDCFRLILGVWESLFSFGPTSFPRRLKALG